MKETGSRFDLDLPRCPGSKPCFVGVQLCWRTRWLRRPRAQFPDLRVPDWPDPARNAGFVSESDSYKAWIGLEEAKQSREESIRRAEPAPTFSLVKLDVTVQKLPY